MTAPVQSQAKYGAAITCLAAAGVYVLDLIVLSLIGSDAKKPAIMLIQAALVWIGPPAVAAITAVGVYHRLRHPEAGIGRVAALAGVVLLASWAILMPAYWRTIADIEVVRHMTPYGASSADGDTPANEAASERRPPPSTAGRDGDAAHN